jgi:hypothetical protein
MQCVSKYHYHFFCLPSQINGRNPLQTLRLQGTRLLSQTCDSQISPHISRLNIAAHHNFPLAQKYYRSPSRCLVTLFFHAFYHLSSPNYTSHPSHILISSSSWIMQSSPRTCEHPPSGIHTFHFIKHFQSIFSSVYDEYTRSVYGIKYMTIFEHDKFKNISRAFQNQGNDLLLPTFL